MVTLIPKEVLASPHQSKSTACHIPIFTFPLFFDLIPFSFIWLALDFIMPWHLLCFPYSVTYNLLHSVLCPLSIFYFLSPLFPSSVFHHPHHFFLSPCLPTPCLSVPFYYYLPNIHSLLLASLFQSLWLCESFSTFSILPHSLSYSKPHSL